MYWSFNPSSRYDESGLIFVRRLPYLWCSKVEHPRIQELERTRVITHNQTLKPTTAGVVFLSCTPTIGWIIVGTHAVPLHELVLIYNLGESTCCLVLSRQKISVSMWDVPSCRYRSSRVASRNTWNFMLDLSNNDLRPWLTFRRHHHRARLIRSLLNDKYQSPLYYHRNSYVFSIMAPKLLYAHACRTRDPLRTQVHKYKSIREVFLQRECLDKLSRIWLWAVSWNNLSKDLSKVNIILMWVQFSIGESAII